MRPIEIKENQDPSIYEEALKHGNQNIRAELANKGYFLDELINDFYPSVRIAVIKRDHSYAKYRKKQGLIVNEWETLYDTLKSVANPDPEVIQMLLNEPFKKVFSKPEQEQYHYKYMDALRLKLKAISKEPSPIEKTMSRYQLFITKNPLWTIAVKPLSVIEIIDAVHWLKNYAQGHHIAYVLNDIIGFDGTVNYTKLNELYR